MSEKFLGTEEDELRARIDVLEGTVEMLGRRNTRLLSVVQLVHDALAAEKWDGRWSNRLMQARQVAHGMLADASVPLGQHLTPNDRLAFDATSGEPIGEPIGEIVMRLREELAWEPEVACDLMSQAADELERLLWRSKVNENIVARLLLTDAEREAVQWAAIRSAADAQMIGGDFYLACQTMRA